MRTLLPLCAARRRRFCDEGVAATLPDWAIVDTTVPPDDKFPGEIVDAGFFDEQWRFTTERPK